MKAKIKSFWARFKVFVRNLYNNPEHGLIVAVAVNFLVAIVSLATMKVALLVLPTLILHSATTMIMLYFVGVVCMKIIKASFPPKLQMVG